MSATFWAVAYVASATLLFTLTLHGRDIRRSQGKWSPPMCARVLWCATWPVSIPVSLIWLWRMDPERRKELL